MAISRSAVPADDGLAERPGAGSAYGMARSAGKAKNSRLYSVSDT